MIVFSEDEDDVQIISGPSKLTTQQYTSVRRATSSSPSPSVRQGWGVGTATHEGMEIYKRPRKQRIIDVDAEVSAQTSENCNVTMSDEMLARSLHAEELQKQTKDDEATKQLVHSLLIKETKQPARERPQAELMRPLHAPPSEGTPLHRPPPPLEATSCIEESTFVITGVLPSLERQKAEQLIRKYGGHVTGSVSGKTRFLVAGDRLEDHRPMKQGCKYKKMLEVNRKKQPPALHCEQLNEDQLLAMIANSRKRFGDGGIETKATAATKSKNKRSASKRGQGQGTSGGGGGRYLAGIEYQPRPDNLHTNGTNGTQQYWKTNIICELPKTVTETNGSVTTLHEGRRHRTGCAAHVTVLQWNDRRHTDGLPSQNISGEQLEKVDTAVAEANAAAGGPAESFSKYQKPGRNGPTDFDQHAFGECAFCRGAGSSISNGAGASWHGTPWPAAAAAAYRTRCSCKFLISAGPAHAPGQPMDYEAEGVGQGQGQVVHAAGGELDPGGVIFQLRQRVQADTGVDWAGTEGQFGWRHVHISAGLLLGSTAFGPDVVQRHGHWAQGKRGWELPVKLRLSPQMAPLRSNAELHAYAYYGINAGMRAGDKGYYGTAGSGGARLASVIGRLNVPLEEPGATCGVLSTNCGIGPAYAKIIEAFLELRASLSTGAAEPEGALSRALAHDEVLHTNTQMEAMQVVAAALARAPCPFRHECHSRHARHLHSFQHLTHPWDEG
jgi:hypothetical protein